MRRVMFGSRTERMSRLPTGDALDLGVGQLRLRTLRRVAMTASDRATPNMVPRPPKMLTPPRRTAAITSNSKPTALSARDDETLAVNMMPGQGGDNARDDEEPELHSGHSDRREPGRFGVRPDRVDLAADPGPVEHDGKDRQQGEEDERRPGETRARDRAEAEVGEVRGIVGDGAVAQDHVGQAAVEGERAKGDDERRQPEPCDEEAVEQTQRPRRRAK